MPVIFAFLALLLACLLLSALIVPWLQPLFAAYLDATPERSLYRFAMLLGLIGLPWLLYRLRLTSRDSLGFHSERHGAAHAIFKGTLLGILILVGLMGGLLLSGARVPIVGLHIDVRDILRVALAGMASGLAVGLIEEFFFRGPMHAGARRTLGFWPTALAIGLFYALVHFIRPSAAPDGDFSICNALLMIQGGLGGATDLNGEPDRFAALWVAGVFLAMVRERTGNILWAIGIHAGWVAIIKLSKLLTRADDAAVTSFLVSEDGITGWLSAAWLLLIAVIYWRLSDPTRRQA